MCKQAGEGKTLPTFGYAMILLWNLFWCLLKDGSLFTVGGVYMRYYLRVNRKVRPGVIGLAQVLNRCVTHWHFYAFNRDVRGLADSVLT